MFQEVRMGRGLEPRLQEVWLEEDLGFWRKEDSGGCCPISLKSCHRAEVLRQSLCGHRAQSWDPWVDIITRRLSRFSFEIKNFIMITAIQSETDCPEKRMRSLLLETYRDKRQDWLSYCRWSPTFGGGRLY